jgi:signal peptidase I
VKRGNHRALNHSGRQASDSAEPGPRAVHSPVWRELASLGVKLAAIGGVVALVLTFLYGLHVTSDADMAPSVKEGDLVLFYQLDKDYSAGDLAALRFDGQIEVRRVVAVAGDTVDITEDGLVVNGALQQELEIFEPTRRYADGTDLPVTLAPGEVFVMGDARQDATDSRVYGAVHRKDTLGTVITVLRKRNL